jgi:hypothetical protein
MNLKQINILNDIVISELEKSNMPFITKNKTVIIRDYVVKETKEGWLVTSSLIKNKRDVLENKASAIALAKGLAERKNLRYEILALDRRLSKHINDCLGYEYILKTSKDREMLASIRSRYNDSQLYLNDIRDSLDRLIFS